MFQKKKQARKLLATLEGCNPKLWLTYSLAHRGKVLIIGREGTLVWTLPKRTSPQPTRGDVELRFDITQFVWCVPLWPVDTIEQYRVVASLNALKFNPLTFFSLGLCFRDIWRWSVDWHRHLAINSHTSLSFRNGPEEGQTLETFMLQSHGRPELKAFQKTPSKFASKNKNMAKNRGRFCSTFMQNTCSGWFAAVSV